MIHISNRQRRIRIDSKAVKIFCGALSESLNISDCAFSVIFVGTASMRRLNCEWRKKDGATDVLSFTYGGEIVDGAPFLGEIVIAPEIAALARVSTSRRDQGSGVMGQAGLQPAEGFVISPTEREIRKLIVHGTLHLAGYDHETDDGEMIVMQNRVLRRRFFTAAPYFIPREKDR